MQIIVRYTTNDWDCCILGEDMPITTMYGNLHKEALQLWLDTSKTS